MPYPPSKGIHWQHVPSFPETGPGNQWRIFMDACDAIRMASDADAAKAVYTIARMIADHPKRP